MPTRSRIVAHRLRGRQGYPAPDYVPKSDEGIVSGTGVTGGMFLRITKKWRIVLQSLLPRPLGFNKCRR